MNKTSAYLKQFFKQNKKFRNSYSQTYNRQMKIYITLLSLDDAELKNFCVYLNSTNLLFHVNYLG